MGQGRFFCAPLCYAVDESQDFNPGKHRMKSMTGFGTGTASLEGTSVTVEVSSVNGKKGLEARFQVPRELGAAIEMQLRPELQKRVARGSVNVTVRYELNAELRLRRFQIDQDLAMSVISSIEELAGKTGLSRDVKVTDVFQIPGVVRENQELPQEQLAGLAKQAFAAACQDFDRMRQQEGAALAADISARVAKMAGMRDELAGFADAALQAWHEKLRERIRLFKLELSLDDERLAKEVAFCAERADINEELIRLQSHFQQFQELLAPEAAAPGRTLEFLCQEIGREINTLGAKAADNRIARMALEFRNDLDRLSEQVRNVE